MTNAEASERWAILGKPTTPCKERSIEHCWAAWEFNHVGDCEYRLCANCGEMEQQWIDP